MNNINIKDQNLFKNGDLSTGLRVYVVVSARVSGLVFAWRFCVCAYMRVCVCRVSARLCVFVRVCAFVGRVVSKLSDGQPKIRLGRLRFKKKKAARLNFLFIYFLFFES